MKVELHQLTDNELAERFRCYRDELAWEALQNNYRGKIFYFVYWRFRNRRIELAGKDVDDIVEEIFIRVFRNINQFRKEGNFRALLYRIARNMCYDEAEIQRNEISTLPLNEVESRDENVERENLIEDEQSFIEDSIEEEQILSLLEECLDELKEKWAEVIILYYEEELNYSEIARIIHLSPGAVKDRINNAVQKLRQCIRIKTGFEF